MAADRAAEVADLAVERKRKRDAAEAAAAELGAATHHDLVQAWRTSRTLNGHAPVYAAGQIHLPTAEGIWAPIPQEAVQVQFAAEFRGAKLCRKNSDYRQLADHASAVCEVPDFFEKGPAGVASPLGFHYLDAAGSVATVPLDLAHRQTFMLSHGPEYEAEAPMTDALLAAAFEGDNPEEQTALFWEVCGAALFRQLPQHQLAVLMIGVQRSGKSTLQRVIEGMFPRDAVCAVSPSLWGQEYHVAALAGKRLNVVGELADDSPIPAASFKNVTGLNLVGARHPTHRPFSFRSEASHIFASNVLPPTTDRSEAFYRRWRVLRFSNTVPPERVDHGLLDKIVAGEMPGILAQAFMGAERVARSGRVRTTPSHDAVLAKWRLAANPLEQFLADDEWVDLDVTGAAFSPTLPELYATYRRWAGEAGFRHIFGRNHFRELLETTGASRGLSISRRGTRDVVAGLRLVNRER